MSQLQGEGDVPKIAVDTGALGGMYANRIRLVSSEKGLGVNLGNLNARQGDITLDANGKLTVKSSLASGAVSMKGQEVALSGDHKAGDNLSITSQGAIALTDSAWSVIKTCSLLRKERWCRMAARLLRVRILC